MRSISWTFLQSYLELPEAEQRRLQLQGPLPFAQCRLPDYSLPACTMTNLELSTILLAEEHTRVQLNHVVYVSFVWILFPFLGKNSDLWKWFASRDKINWHFTYGSAFLSRTAEDNDQNHDNHQNKDASSYPHNQSHIVVSWSEEQLVWTFMKKGHTSVTTCAEMRSLSILLVYKGYHGGYQKS